LQGEQYAPYKFNLYKSAYALVIHDAPGEWVQGVANMPCRRLSGYLTPKELLLWLDGYHAGLQANKNK